MKEWRVRKEEKKVSKKRKERKGKQNGTLGRYGCLDAS